MLRDLDQRRKSSDSAGTTVKLMPASDHKAEKSNNSLMVMLLGLVVIVAALAWFWFQQTATVTDRQLDIQPRVVSNGSASPATNSTVAGSVSEELPAQQLVAEVDAEAEATVQPGQPANSNAEESATDPASILQQAVAANSSSALNEEAVSPASEAPVAPVSSGSAATNISQSVQTETVDIRNQAAVEGVKNEAQMSAEDLDTLAVQEALRMIANNNVTGAYAHLEQHIINNRYAHQSRETYAKLLMNDGELLAAYNLIESGMQLAPNHPGYKKVKARILIADGQINEAVSLLSRRAPDISQDLEYHEILATALLASRDFEGAALSYTSLVQQDQSQGKWWYGFAASHDSMGNSDAAIQAYSRALQQGNLSPNLRRRSQERLTALSQ
jgi:MSHA biogenesis protein MshN